MNRLTRSTHDYFISTEKYARQDHVCVDCGRDIGAGEFCMTDGDEVLCCQCVNRWLGIDRYTTHIDLVNFLEALGCDACECPDEEEYSRTELFREQTAYMFAER
ncbi:MAG: hypothetical protein ACI4QZ_07270 [Eubacteriales bacterium]